MTTIESLMKDAVRADQNVLAAERSRKVAFKALLGAVQTRFELYCKTFKPLNLRAEDLDYRIPEIHKDGFSNGNIRWGNGGLSEVPVSENGFTCINTYEEESIIARIPSKYLLDGGEQTIREDAARIKTELDNIQSRKEVEAERLQRDEYARLKEKFG